MAAVGIPWEPLNRDAMLFPGGPPIWDDRECLVQHQTMVETTAFGSSIANTLRDRYAMILAHHGIVVAHDMIGDVVRTAFYLERAAQAHLTAASIKAPPFMSEELKKDINDVWTRDEPGFGLSSPARVVANEQWAMMQAHYLDQP